MTDAHTEPRPQSDPELRAVLPSIPAGAVATFLVCLASMPYLAATMGDPNRGAIAVLMGIGMLGGGLVLVLPRERLLGSGFRNVFFVAWTSVDVALITA